MYRIRGTIRAVCSGNQPPAQLTRQRGPLQCPSWALTRLQVWEAQRDLGPNPLTHHHRSVFPSSSTSRIAECQTASSRSCPGKSPTGARQHQREPRRRKGRARREFHPEIQGFRQKKTSESRWRRGRSRTCRCSSSSPTFSSRYATPPWLPICVNRPSSSMSPDLGKNLSRGRANFADPEHYRASCSSVLFPGSPLDLWILLLVSIF